jgi:threonine aldolase
MIDLRSDTVTKPSAGMREAMARAAVGDDVYGEDPTVNQLQERMAALLGKAAALFVPSGTMANQLALRLHAQPGQEVIVESKAHMVRYEQGAGGALAGVQFHWIAGTRGLITAEQVETAIRPKDPHTIQTALIAIENTHNSGGGTIYPRKIIEEIRQVAERHRIPMHLDGARLFNAASASGTSAIDYARSFETVSCCLSKGLGAPAGSLLATNDPGAMDRLRRFRRMYGGAMRQAGILAAAGLYALDHNVKRLSTDHDNAKRFARAIHTIPQVRVNPDEVDTNIVFFEVTDGRLSPADLVAALKREGVLLNAVGGTQFRAVTHLDVTAKDIDTAAEVLRHILAAWQR